jgi:hypothetical protein
MFKATILGGLALLGAWSPLAAQVFTVSINGGVTGTQTTLMCGPSNVQTCLSTYPNGTVSADFARSFDFTLFTANLAQGDTPFTSGLIRAGGYWTGIINNSNGLLTGRDLFYSIEDANCRFGTVGCRYASASAASFNVVGGIPEPATWATMLLGFLAIGTAMRRRPHRALVRATA